MKKNKKIEFISYTGKYPTLCKGVLTLKIDNVRMTFGYDFDNRKPSDYKTFWSSGGSCGFFSNYEKSFVNRSSWKLDSNALPNELKPYGNDLIEVFNKNVPFGCCGGCL